MHMRSACSQLISYSKSMSLALQHQCFLVTLIYTCSLFFNTTQSQLMQKNSNTNIKCTSKCGSLEIQFPFYLNGSSTTSPSSSCGSILQELLSDAFRLSCINSTSLFLNIAADSYQVLRFFQDGVLVDFPNTSTCRRYNDLRSFRFSGNQYFGISSDNVLDLYDCEDSSVCRATDCERTSVSVTGCERSGMGTSINYPSSCCYPLSDPSAWRPGNSSFTRFSQYGCRGFSSWVNLPAAGSSNYSAERGVKLEWAVPANLTSIVCAANAEVINATSVASGIRCQCPDGFVGDGFAIGSGCTKPCSKDGEEFQGNGCHRNINYTKKKAIVLAGILTSAFAAISLMALFCLLKRRMRLSSDQLAHHQSSFSSEKARSRRPRLFTYHELEEATKGFVDEQKVVDGSISALYAGTLDSGSRVAVHRVLLCQSERDFIRILFRVEALSAVSHKNMARILGWSIDSGNAPMVVYDYPENGNLDQHLHRARQQQTPLDWFKRLNIAAETASVLSFLHDLEISPPIFHHDLQPGYIFLDVDFSVKLAGFEITAVCEMETSSTRGPYSSKFVNDVCSLGIVLLRIITGNTTVNFCSTTALHKIKRGKLEEIVDPSLYYHEQPTFRREQIEKIADLATRCLLFGADGKLGMIDVAKELVHIAKDSVDRSSRRGPAPALEETFSNSSLLQMISMSPDSSIYLPS